MGMLPGSSEQQGLTSKNEQLTISRRMQPRDQTSDCVLKEKLRASGAIQDFWKGSVGRSSTGELLSPGQSEDKGRANPPCPALGHPSVTLFRAAGKGPATLAVGMSVSAHEGCCQLWEAGPKRPSCSSVLCSLQA